MKVKSFDEIQNFLKYELGLDDSTILLGLKLSHKNKALLPVSMWSYGILDYKELDKLYKFIYEN